MLFERLLSGQKVAIESPIALSEGALENLGVSRFRNTRVWDLPLVTTSPTFAIGGSVLLLRIPSRFGWAGGNTADLALADAQGSPYHYTGFMRHPRLFVGLHGLFLAVSAGAFLMGIALLAVTVVSSVAFVFARQFLRVGGATFTGFAASLWVSNFLGSRAHARRIVAFFERRGVPLVVRWV